MTLSNKSILLVYHSGHSVIRNLGDLAENSICRDFRFTECSNNRRGNQNNSKERRQILLHTHTLYLLYIYFDITFYPNFHIYYML